MYILIVIGVVGFIGFYYWRYFANINRAGGREEAGKIYWRELFGLDADEQVVSMGMGTWYLGPLVPESMRSGVERVFDAIGGITYRGANMWVAFTSKNRLALAVEPTEDGPQAVRSSITMQKGYAPLAIFGEPRPYIEAAEQAWPGSDLLPTDRQKPVRVNTHSQKVRQDLIRLTDRSSGRQMVFFVEGQWVGFMQSWAQGGAVAVDPRWMPRPDQRAAPAA